MDTETVVTETKKIANPNPQRRLADLIFFESKRSLLNNLRAVRRWSAVGQSFAAVPFCRILIYGNAGSGKTTATRLIAEALDADVVCLPRLRSLTRTQFRETLNAARAAPRPSLFVIEDLDRQLKSESLLRNNNEDGDRVSLPFLLDALDGHDTSAADGIFLAITARETTNLPCGIFARTCLLPLGNISMEDVVRTVYAHVFALAGGDVDSANHLLRDNDACEAFCASRGNEAICKFFTRLSSKTVDGGYHAYFHPYVVAKAIRTVFTEAEGVPEFENLHGSEQSLWLFDKCMLKLIETY